MSRSYIDVYQKKKILILYLKKYIYKKLKKLFKKLVIFSFLHKFFFSKKQFTNLRVRLNGGVEKWENRKLREDGKYSVFPLVCLVGEVEKWEG